MAVFIETVDENTPAHKAGLRGGMQLFCIDGHEILDGIDYEFYSASQNPVLLASESKQAPQQQFLVIKSETEDLGCRFASYLIGPQHSCKNHCQFCFIDQLPKGLRQSLYFKDDDERLGFLFGNYITLTNLQEREIERIIEMRISPINVSVHTANIELRCELMGNKNAGKVLDFLPRLAKEGIALNTQLVLCPDVNDGKELKKSIEWLETLYPALQSIAAVPVGLTKYREGLASLETYTPQKAAVQLEIMLSYGELFLRKYEERLVYPSDEWFLLAGRPLPEYEFYGGFHQLENGVGMWRMLHDEFVEALGEANELPSSISADIVTGVLAAPLLKKLAMAVKARSCSANIQVHEIQNEFFGPNITVTGLLTGRDIVNQMRGKLHTNRILIAENMLRAEGDLFLCGMSVEELETELSVKVEVVPCNGDSLLQALLAE